MEQSNVFEIQVDDLLKSELNEELSKNQTYMLWLERFKTYLKNITIDCSTSIEDFSLGGSVEVPIVQNPETCKGFFKFIAPTNIAEIGSFTLGTICRSNPTVDIAVEIPKACWQGMDYLNHRYHRKRAFYISCIASSLLKSGIVADLKFKYQNECYFKPMLLIFPKGVQNVTVCLIAYPPENVFKVGRFAPSKNNVRSSWYFSEEKDVDQPTPYFNASILSDILLPECNAFLKDTISSQSLKDGIKLIKLWCLQRDLVDGYGRLNGFIISMYVAFLLKKKKLNRHMSACQIFRLTLLCFQNQDWFKQGVSLSDKTLDVAKTEAFLENYKVLFLDPSGKLNLCYFVNKETIIRMQHEAKLGLKILEKESLEGFYQLFMHKMKISNKFEYLLHFNENMKFDQYLQRLDLERQSLNFGGNILSSLTPKVCELLKKGLNSRILLIDVCKVPHDPWPVGQSPPLCNSGQVSFGFLLNPDGSPLSSIEKGPAADDPEAKEFRNFWGERSELRRFQDGSIREAVHWPSKTIGDKRKVFPQIITDILKRHLNAGLEDVTITGTEVNVVLEIPQQILSSDFAPYGTGEESHLTLIQCFDSLCKNIRNLTGLPLLIASIQGVSPSFRFAEVFPPLARNHERNHKNTTSDGYLMKLNDGYGCPPYTPALKAVISLEGSGKWPDDASAIKRVKAAFYIKIVQEIRSQLSLMAVAYPTHVDVFKNGYIFRFEIACHKEIFLLKQVRLPNGCIRIEDSKESKELEMSTEIIPKLNSMMHGLQQQHNSFGTACRLAKRWISAQLKRGFLKDICVELLVAHLYIHPEPYSVPSSPQVAFVRFLHLLSNHDWASSIIVNLNNELTSADIDEINTAFSTQRSNLPPMVIIHPLDKKGNMWTEDTPVGLILKRISYLAEASLKVLDNILNRTQDCDIKSIFRPPLNSYDVLIYLDRMYLPRLSCAVDLCDRDQLPVYDPYERRSQEEYPIVEFDPVKNYLKELRENFGDIAFFLHDIYGGDYIAVVWRLSAFKPKEFHESQVTCRNLSSDGTKMVPNVESILEDFQILGSGLVDKIVKQAENWQIP